MVDGEAATLMKDSNSVEGREYRCGIWRRIGIFESSCDKIMSLAYPNIASVILIR